MNDTFYFTLESRRNGTHQTTFAHGGRQTFFYVAFVLGLFEQDVFETEGDCYVEKCNRYGTPLDSRREYTKSDWLMWVAALTECEEKRNALIAALDLFLKETPDRVPFGDWYETVSGIHHAFRARTVQGGCFILLLR